MNIAPLFQPLVFAYSIWQKHIKKTNKNAHTFAQLKELIGFYNSLLSVIDKFKEFNDDQLRQYCYNNETYITDEEYLIQILIILEDLRITPISLNSSILKQIIFIKHLIKYEQTVRNCWVIHLIPNSKPIKELMQFPVISDTIKQLIKKESYIKECIKRLYSDIK